MTLPAINFNDGFEGPSRRPVITGALLVGHGNTEAIPYCETHSIATDTSLQFPTSFAKTPDPAQCEW